MVRPAVPSARCVCALSEERREEAGAKGGGPAAKALGGERGIGAVERGEQRLELARVGHVRGLGVASRLALAGGRAGLLGNGFAVAGACTCIACYVECST